MKNYKEQTLMECLKWCGVPSLPEKDDKENIWIKAIALVAKSDGSESYCVLGKDANLENRIIKDFGATSIIRVIKEVYPYHFLSAVYMPEFKGKGKEERINWLAKHGVKEDLSELSVKELNKRVVLKAIQKQILQEKTLNI